MSIVIFPFFAFVISIEFVPFLNIFGFFPLFCHDFHHFGVQSCFLFLETPIKTQRNENCRDTMEWKLDEAEKHCTLIETHLQHISEPQEYFRRNPIQIAWVYGWLALGNGWLLIRRHLPVQSPPFYLLSNKKTFKVPDWGRNTHFVLVPFIIRNAHHMHIQSHSSDFSTQ